MKHTKTILLFLKERGYSRFTDIFLGLKINPGTVDWYLKHFKKYGLVEQGSDKLYAITDSGLEILDNLDYI